MNYYYVGFTSDHDPRSVVKHHGILGQKWGQKNGPPYPLDSDISTGSRLKIPVSENLPSTRLKTFNTRERDAKLVNPGFPKAKGSVTNCLDCTIAFELRRRGYDVTATANRRSDFDASRCFDKARITYIKDRPTKQETADATKKALLKQGDGARGALIFAWDGSDIYHAIAYGVDKGSIKLIDPQAGIVMSDVDRYLSHVNNIEFMRFDDKKIDPIRIKDYAK